MSERTVFDWRRGKYTIPAQHFDKIIAVANITSQELRATILKDWWGNKEAGKKGGAGYFQKYRVLGSNDSRRLGGVNSFIKQKDKKDSIFMPKVIKTPVNSSLLAEFMGIMIGDGCLTKYQAMIATNATTDHEYGFFVAKLIENLFGVKPAVINRESMNCTCITASSTELVKFLKLRGLLEGNKIKQGLDIPAWIQSNREYSKACIRGIFDTDGCIFQELHRIKGEMYSYQRWSIVSASPFLRKSIYNILYDLEFSPKIRNNRSINLESSVDVIRYFKLIGTSNSKHLNRFNSFGGVG
ncbi:MAG TPA: hypothetical protein VMR95_03735 [Candidatus Binatia bacterium]|nr:hypothetical protein [Candidatus Binatia bacterium]